MSATTILILTLFAIGAAFVQRTTGFGFGIFIMTWLPYLLPTYGEATTLSGALAMVTSAYLAIRYRKALNWRKLLPILLTFMIVSALAVMMVGQLRSETLQKILGSTLILAAVYFWFLGEKVRVKPTLATQVSLGTISGFMGGLFGMQGPPAVIYFLEVAESKEAYTALAQTFFILGNGVMTIYRAYSGFLTMNVVKAWCFALPAVFIGTWIGGKVYNHIHIELLKKIVYIFIAVSGIIALL